MRNTIYVMLRDCVRFKENMLKHKKDVCSEECLQHKERCLFRRMFAVDLKDIRN